MLLKALPLGDVRKELQRNPLPTYQEMLARAKYLALEEEDDEVPVKKEKKSVQPAGDSRKRKDFRRGSNPTVKAYCIQLAYGSHDLPLRNEGQAQINSGVPRWVGDIHVPFGTTGVEDLECVISFPHLCMKLPTSTGVGVAMGNQSLSWSCYVRATKSYARIVENVNMICAAIQREEGQPMEEPGEEGEEVILDPAKPGRKVKVSKALGLILESSVIGWPVDQAHRQVKQKKRFLSLERRDFVTKEISEIQLLVESQIAEYYQGMKPEDEKFENGERDYRFITHEYEESEMEDEQMRSFGSELDEEQQVLRWTATPVYRKKGLAQLNQFRACFLIESGNDDEHVIKLSSSSSSLRYIMRVVVKENLLEYISSGCLDDLLLSTLTVFSNSVWGTFRVTGSVPSLANLSFAICGAVFSFSDWMALKKPKSRMLRSGELGGWLVRMMLKPFPLAAAINSGSVVEMCGFALSCWRKGVTRLASLSYCDPSVTVRPCLVSVTLRRSAAAVRRARQGAAVVAAVPPFPRRTAGIAKQGQRQPLSLPTRFQLLQFRDFDNAKPPRKQEQIEQIKGEET
ncbi:unnamed protein product [Cuscuta campestris]|uniref:Uncharacterized protein n=1 Tax=Cuscuta campestris TaxID=132261 RepID=A0A484LXD5_9ASTE|nr:unnamed protein product [Cuscuta campestris]